MNESPAEVLERNVVLTTEQVAYVCGLLHTRGAKKGKPDRGAAFKLIHDHKLPLVDPDQPVTRWTVSAAAVKRYLTGDTKRGAA